MRNISAGMQAVLESEAMRLAQLLTITRKDGVILRLTSSNTTLIKNGIVFNPLNPISEATGQNNKIGTGVDNLDIVGLIDSDEITPEDLLAGLYDNSSILIEIVDMDNTENCMIQFAGNIGDVSIRDTDYTAQLRSLTQKFIENIGNVTCATCRVSVLGDGDCGISITSMIDTANISVVNNRSSFVVDIGTRATDFYTYGIVEFTSGNNDNLKIEIKMSTKVGSTTIIETSEPLPRDIQVGDTVILTVGCDRLLPTCKAKFDNAINFRGEPFLPGNDKIQQRGRKY